MKEIDNEIADVLSRNPLWSSKTNEYGPQRTDDFGKEITVQANICVAKAIKKYEDRILSDPLLEEMRYTVNMDN